MVSSISQKSENSQNSQNRQIKQRKKWEFQQTKKYYEFLLRHRNILQQTEKKQKQRIYNRMAEHVGTRTTHQCRSHHQKVMKRYISIDNFIVEFRRKLQTLSNSQNLQGVFNLDQVIGKKRSRALNKTKLKLKQGLGLNIQQQLKKLIQINRSQKQKQQIIEIIKTLKGLTGKKSNYLNDQTNGKKNYPLSNDFKSTSYKAFEGSSRMQYSNDPRGPLNKYSTISNYQIDAQYEWVSRVFQNFNPYEQFFTNIFPPRENQTGTLYPDYSYVPLLMREMADKTLGSQSQNRPLQNLAYMQSPEQIIYNAAFICASVIQRENLNTINPYIKQNNIIVTPQKIHIPYKKDKNSNIFVQCVKAEQLSQEEMANSNSQSMQREKIKQVLIQVLRKQGLIKNIKNNFIIAQQCRHEIDISPMEIEENKKQFQKPIFVQKEPKIQENHKFNPQFSVHYNLKALKSKVHDQHQEEIFCNSEDEYMENKLEGKEMNEKLPKTATCQQEAERQRLNYYMKKSYKSQGRHQNPPYYEGIHLTQEPKLPFNYHSYVFPKIQDNHKFNPQFPVHIDFNILKSQVQDKHQQEIVRYSQDEYIKMKLESIEMNEKLPKTAPSQQEAEKQALDQYLKKSYENNGIHQIPPYHEEIHLSQDQKRKQWLANYQHQKKLSEFPPTQEPKHPFKYNPSPYPFPLSSSPPQYPNFFHLYPSDSSFSNYGYPPYSYPTHFQQQTIHHQNFLPNPFINPQYTETKENFPQKKKFK